MNMKSLSLVILVTVLSYLTPTAHAATLLSTPNGTYTGIEDIMIKGTSYTATFHNTFDSSYTVSDNTFALNAAVALRSLVRLGEFVNTEFDRDASDTLGCALNSIVCSLFTTYNETSSQLSGYTLFNFDASSGGDYVDQQTINLASPYPSISYVEWSPSQVPVPAAIWFMGSGLIALTVLSRKNKMQ